MLKIDIKSTLKGKIAKIVENRKKMVTFVPANRNDFLAYDRYLGFSRQKGCLFHPRL